MVRFTGEDNKKREMHHRLSALDENSLFSVRPAALLQPSFRRLAPVTLEEREEVDDSKIVRWDKPKVGPLRRGVGHGSRGSPDFGAKPQRSV